MSIHDPIEGIGMLPTQYGTTSGAGKTQKGKTIYALIKIDYEGNMVLRADSMEELREEIDMYTRNGYAKLEAIFYADIIEGSLT